MRRKYADSIESDGSEQKNRGEGQIFSFFFIRINERLSKLLHILQFHCKCRITAAHLRFLWFGAARAPTVYAQDIQLSLFGHSSTF